MLQQAVDPDLLRTFSQIAREGSFTRAASQVGRTQSAVSMQLQRLEMLLGKRLLVRGKGGSIQITPHGAWLLSRAQEVLALNDGILAAFHAPEVAGKARLAIPDDYVLRFLPAILRGFAETHPAVEVEVVCAPSSEAVRQLHDGKVDLAIVSAGHRSGAFEEQTLWRGPLMWIIPTRYAVHQQDPLPLALAAGDCLWREAALSALEQAGRRYRIAYTSASQTGSIAPVLAGLAVTVSPMTLLPEGLRAEKGGAGGLPKLPDAGILLLKGHPPHSSAADALARYIPDSFRAASHRGDAASGDGADSRPAA
jgi:DNA-binding transcriptional LysR family regulator